MTDWPPPQIDPTPPTPVESSTGSGFRTRWWFIASGAVIAVLGVVALRYGELPATSTGKGVEELAVGDCFDFPDGSEFATRLDILACDQPHDAEIFDTTTAPAIDLDGEAITKCERRRRTALGERQDLPPGHRIEALVGFTDEGLTLEALGATGEHLDDVPVYCVLHHPQGLDRPYLINVDGG